MDCDYFSLHSEFFHKKINDNGSLSRQQLVWTKQILKKESKDVGSKKRKA